ncbi:hypothetical protein VTL71DRAFT_6536 [Oculimacula yallundae]|uniref:MYND-type domain-containing protein n=1 Tax=Oculimacula yallundae TaxID=86028 RepID=A0ABR4BX80_9HELO
MDLPNCTICRKPSTEQCKTCNSAAYCSPACQNIDEPLHSLLCTKIRDFVKTTPRPADTDNTSHKLGILFPVDSNTPELIWVRNTVCFEDNGKSWDVSVDLKKYIPDAMNPRGPTRESGECNVDVYMGDSCYGRDKPNECLGHLLDGYQWTDGGEVISEHKWVGAVVVLRSKRMDDWDGNEDTWDDYGEPGAHKLFEDITLTEFRSALQYMGGSAWLYEAESKKENPYFIRNESEWTKAVKISCDGDMKILGKKRYRDVMVSSLHEIHNSDDGNQVSEISVHMGMALQVFKCGFQGRVVQAHNADKRIGAFENGDASVLMLRADPGNQHTWGTSDFEEWDRGMEPTVLIVRQNSEPINAKQVEALVNYIKEVLSQAFTCVVTGEPVFDPVTQTFEEPEDEEMFYEPKDIVNMYMKSAKFEAYFEWFKKEQMAEGDSTWVDIKSPRAV